MRNGVVDYIGGRGRWRQIQRGHAYNGSGSQFQNFNKNDQIYRKRNEVAKCRGGQPSMGGDHGDPSRDGYRKCWWGEIIYGAQGFEAGEVNSQLGIYKDWKRRKSGGPGVSPPGRRDGMLQITTIYRFNEIIQQVEVMESLDARDPSSKNNY